MNVSIKDHTIFIHNRSQPFIYDKISLSNSIRVLWIKCEVSYKSRNINGVINIWKGYFNHLNKSELNNATHFHITLVLNSFYSHTFTHLRKKLSANDIHGL
jgi:hypothetical protein